MIRFFHDANMSTLNLVVAVVRGGDSKIVKSFVGLNTSRTS